MSVPLILQVLGWVAVLWLATVQVLIRRNLVLRDGLALRIAGCAAAIAVFATGVSAHTWPVTLLGLLWLRTEVFGHRYPNREQTEQTDGEHTEPEESPAADLTLLPDPDDAPEVPARLRVGTRTSVRPARRRRSGLHVHLPHWGPRVVNLLFDIEIAVVIAIALILFGIWAQQEREGFGNRADDSLCSFMGGC